MHIPSLSGVQPADRFGQPLAPGDLVTYEPPLSLTFQVMDVRPVINRPGAPVPPGSFVLVLKAIANLPGVTGQPLPVIRVGYLGPGDRPVIGSPVRARGQQAEPEPGPPVPETAEPPSPAVDLPDLPDPPGPGLPPGPRLVLP